MFRWLISAINRDGFRRSRPARPHGFRPGLEALEDRCVPTLIPVTSTGLLATQPGTLPYAVAHAQNGDVINIETSQPIVLTQGEIYLNHNLTIEATGKQAVISGDHLSRVFEIAPTAQVQLVNLDVVAGAGVARNALGSPNQNGNGGGILNQGKLTLNNCTVSGNSAVYGGGIDNMNVLTLNNCTVSGNSALMFGGGVNNYGTLTVIASTMNGDVATYDGGGINTEEGTVSLNGDQFLKNSAQFGGALDNFHGTVAMTNSLVSQNSAGIAGGMYNDDGAMAVTHSTVSLNAGDGICTVGSDPLEIGQSVFVGNTPHSVVGAYINLGGNSGI